MAEQEKSFFDRLGELLNSPLPGTEASPSVATSTAKKDDDSSLIDRVKDILNTPLPGSEEVEKQVAEVGQLH